MENLYGGTPYLQKFIGSCQRNQETPWRDWRFQKGPGILSQASRSPRWNYSLCYPISTHTLSQCWSHDHLEWSCNYHGRSTIIALCCHFHCLRLDRAESMSAYIAHIHHLTFLLEEANVPMSEDDIILGITSRLPHSYDSFLISLDATADSDYTLNNVIARLINEYQRQHQSQPHSQSNENSQPNEAMLVSSPSSRNNLMHITCFACGQMGHFQSSPNCPSRNKSSPAPEPKDAAHFLESIEVDEEDGVF